MTVRGLGQVGGQGVAAGAHQPGLGVADCSQSATPRPGGGDGSALAVWQCTFGGVCEDADAVREQGQLGAGWVAGVEQGL